MRTDHRVIVGDARDLSDLADDAVELVVTSPPYPMIEMWDDLFSSLDPDIGECLEMADGDGAFERMHAVLDDVWSEVARVLVDGGIACVNVGNATRTLDGRFRVYQNDRRVSQAFEALGFDPLPEILWRKPANSGTKFMGSGMLPPNAYVTLEHEFVLVFRNGPSARSFEPKATRRYEAAYFWEERNRWFSDVWMDVTGDDQRLEGTELRERSGAFPFELPYRLLNMYSVYGDTVLDPFWGTGTTTLAAMAAGRHSVGVELEEAFRDVFEDRLEGLPAHTDRVIEARLEAHREFVSDRRDEGKPPTYDAEHYDFPVTTRQERSIRFYRIESIEESTSGYRVTHEPVG